MLVYSLFCSLCICVRLVSLLSTKVVGEPLPELAEVLTDKIPDASVIQSFILRGQLLDILIGFSEVLSKLSLARVAHGKSGCGNTY